MLTRITEGVTYGKVADEAVLVSKDGVTLKLDDQAIILWEMIMEGYNEERMINHFVALYPDQKDSVVNDIKDFFSTLKKEGMIEQLDLGSSL